MERHNFTGFILLISTTEHLHVGLKLSADRSKYRRTKWNQTQSMDVNYSVVMTNPNFCNTVHRHGLGHVTTCACLIYNESNVPGKKHNSQNMSKTAWNCGFSRFTVRYRKYIVLMMNLVRGDLGDGCGRIELGSLKGQGDLQWNGVHSGIHACHMHVLSVFLSFYKCLVLFTNFQTQWRILKQKIY